MQSNHSTRFLALLYAALLLTTSCTTINFESEELQPIQSNFRDGDLSIVILTESTFVDREANEKLDMRKEVFPPRVLVYFSSPIEYKDSQLELSSLQLTKPDGSIIPVLSIPIKLTLRDSWYKDYDKYQTYGHLKNLGGLETVRNIYISAWLQEIELNNSYVLQVKYVNLQNEVKELKVKYVAQENNLKTVVPSRTYWNSI